MNENAPAQIALKLALQIKSKQRRSCPRLSLLNSLCDDVQKIMRKPLKADYLDELKREAFDRRNWIKLFTHSADKS